MQLFPSYPSLFPMFIPQSHLSRCQIFIFKSDRTRTRIYIPTWKKRGRNQKLRSCGRRPNLDRRYRTPVTWQGSRCGRGHSNHVITWPTPSLLILSSNFFFSYSIFFFLFYILRKTFFFFRKMGVGLPDQKFGKCRQDDSANLNWIKSNFKIFFWNKLVTFH